MVDGAAFTRRDGLRAARRAVLPALLLLAACRPGEAPGVAAARAAATAAEAAPVCEGSDPHTRHVNLGFACVTCHPRGGEYAASGALPGGAPIEGTITRGAPTTCAVTCHSPLGAPPQTVAWDSGPKGCVSCHVQQSRSAPGIRSAHGASDDPAVCLGCHDQSAHTRGEVRLAGAPGAPIDEACIRCHSGAGSLLAGGMAPLLVGWRDPAGDWHGDRAGAGHGGELLAPHARGAAALPCRSCHDPHTSTNAFLLAATVNGRALPAGAIGRQGVGAEALCGSCHQGERHATCSTCHTGAADHAPSGSACFFCHGHEGIVNLEPPQYPADHGPRSTGSCTHCHSSGWLPPAEGEPPRITGGLVQATEIGTATALVVWDTSEPATSYVELGDGATGRVAGDGALVTRHRVALAGLAEATSYTFRVRSSDAMRNVVRSPTLSFATASARGPLAPALVEQPPVSRGDATFSVLLRWGAVTDPDGGPVQYRLVASHTAAFEVLDFDSGWITATEALATFTDAGDPCSRYWRVQARDADGLLSPWSSTGSFPVYWQAY